MDPGIAAIMRFGIHRSGVLRPEALHDWTRQLFARFRPRVPFGLAVVELPWLRLRLVRDSDITWQHLAASCAIPLGFPPVAIQGTRYVDGGLRGGLPLWAAEEMGATRAVALDVLNTPGFRMLHKALRWRDPGPALQLARIEPSSRLGSLRDAVVWSAERVTRWVAQGEIDGTRAATSITM